MAESNPLFLAYEFQQRVAMVFIAALFALTIPPMRGPIRALALLDVFWCQQNNGKRVLMAARLKVESES